MDKIIFTGNIGKDAEYNAKDGRGMVRFPVALNKTVKGEKVSEWRNVTAFGKQADFCREYAKKGRSVLIEGRPSAHAYKNKLDELQASIDVLADRVELIGGRPEGNGAATDTSARFVVANEGDMPF